MADSQSIVALNIGSQRVSMAAFSPQKGGNFTLKGFREVDILADPANEATRSAEVRAAVTQLANELKVGKSRINASVSGHSVITKFVKLPPIDSDDMSELVEMEAQQQIPFPLDEGAWDWAALDGGGIEKEVLLVAIRQEVLDDISDTVSGAGLSLKQVGSSPTSLYNAFRYNYPEVEEPVLLVDIGAKSTELLYIEGKKLYMQAVNSPGTTGTTLTSSIAKFYNVPFADAEGYKVNGGFVDVGNTEGLDEGTVALAGHIRSSVERIPNEISRRTNFYRSQQGGNAPTKVFLSGGGANLPYLVDFLQQKLSLPVETFNPLRRLNVSDQSANQKAHVLGELVGLAVEEAGHSEIKIDLVPTSVEADRASARRKPWLIAASGILLAGFGAWAGLKYVAASKAEEKLVEVSERQEELAPYASKLKRWSRDLAETESIGEEYAALQDSRVAWMGILTEVRSYFASETVWMTNLRPYVNYELGKEDSGKSYIKSGYERLTYGETFVDRRSADSRNRKGSAKVNAIRIDGFWRAGVDGKNHRAVAEILDKVKSSVESAYKVADENNTEPNTYFKLTKADKFKPRKIVPLSDAEILTNNDTSLGQDTYGAAFTMILPLRDPIPFKQITAGKSL